MILIIQKKKRDLKLPVLAAWPPNRLTGCSTRSRGLVPKRCWSDIIGSRLVSLKLSHGDTSCHPIRCRSEFRALQHQRRLCLQDFQTYLVMLGLFGRNSCHQTSTHASAILCTSERSFCYFFSGKRASSFCRPSTSRRCAATY